MVLEMDGKSSSGLIISWHCCFCHRLPLLLPDQSRAAWCPRGQAQAQGTNPALGLADQSMTASMCRGEQTQALGFYLEAKKQSPLERREGESWGQKGVGAVVLPKHTLAEK